MKLTRERILEIPKLLETMTNKEVAQNLGVHVQTVVYWVRRLKDEGYQISSKAGRPKMQLKQTNEEKTTETS